MAKCWKGLARRVGEAGCPDFDAALQWDTALHEAGHAVAAILLGADFAYVALGDPGDGSTGRLHGHEGPWVTSSWERLERKAVVTLAGPVVSHLVYGFSPSYHRPSDMYGLQGLFRLMRRPRPVTPTCAPRYARLVRTEWRQWRNQLWSTAKLLVTPHWRPVSEVASALDKSRYLPRDAVRDIVLGSMHSIEELFRRNPGPIARALDVRGDG